MAEDDCGIIQKIPKKVEPNFGHRFGKIDTVVQEKRGGNV